VAWGQRLENEFDNIKYALDWAVINQKTETALRMLLSLGWSWDMRCHYNEARGWFEKIGTLPDISLYPALYAKLQNHIGRHTWVLADYRHARSLLEQSLAIWQNMENPPEDGLAETLEYLGLLSWTEGNINAADEFFKESLNLYQKCEHRRGIAESVFFLGIVEDERGNQSLALSRYEHSLDLFSLSKDLWGIARVSQLLGEFFLQQGNYEKARQIFEQGLKIDEELQVKDGIATALANLGSLYRKQGEDQRARWYLERSHSMAKEYDLKVQILVMAHDLGYIALKYDDISLAAKYFGEGIAIARKIGLLKFADMGIAGLAAVAAGRNQPELSAVLFGAAQAMTPAIQKETSSPNAVELHRRVDSARKQVDTKRFESLQDEGRRMTFDQAIDFALSKAV
jgi:tetratricopeptide (TPR) repeat protein